MVRATAADVTVNRRSRAGRACRGHPTRRCGARTPPRRRAARGRKRLTPPATLLRLQMIVLPCIADSRLTPMLLSELLNAAAIDPRLKATSKREAVAELVALLESAHGLDSRGEILDRVLRREAMMSTGIGNGVAIPHGKARAVDRMLAACGVPPAAVA